MQIILTIVMIASSVALIASVLLQEGKSAGMSGTIAGGAETLFGKNKAKGFQGLLKQITFISSIVFMLSVFIFSVLY